MKHKTGLVYLIGAGPGDPGLLTLRARDCIMHADVVIYDFLAAPALLTHSRKNAEIIYVGKKAGNHTLSQDNINLLLIEKARQGLNVARLKGGDPFVFGRGGEEAQVLAAQGIPFEIVPGVTSAIAAPAYAGIPVTHRDHTGFVTFITGHEDPDRPDSRMQWDVFGRSEGTLVFLMGVRNLETIVTRLIFNGKSPETPAALVQWGTLPRQKSVTGTLSTICNHVTAAGITSPAVIIVGNVVTLREQLAWYESRPLFGKTIVVTRAREQASGLVAELTRLGADCIEIPTIHIAPPDDTTPLTNAITHIQSFDWLVFTSVNGVSYFFDTLFAMGMDVRVLSHLRFACIGPVTRDRLRDFGIISDILPETYRAESVVTAFAPHDMTGSRVLLPRARNARTILPESLSQMGAQVTEVIAYETLPDGEGRDRLFHLLAENRIEVVTFTSSSTVVNFMSLLDTEAARDRLKNVTLASIGPITSDTIRSYGLTPRIEADVYTIPGLVEKLLAYYGDNNPS